MTTIEDPCQRCSTRAVSYVPDDRRLCRWCYIDEYVPFTPVFRRGLPDWVEPTLRGDKVAEWLCRFWLKERMPHVTVYVFSRAEAATLTWLQQWWVRHHGATPPPYYGFRGWSDYYQGHIILLADDTEIPESLTWLLLHELGHIACRHIPMIDQAWDAANTAANYVYDWADDDAHEACVEEQFVNRLATIYVGKSYDRRWWRQRVREVTEAHD